MSTVYYRVGDRAFDSTGNQEYICVTAGDKTSSGWIPLGSMVGVPNYRGTWSGASSYAISDVVSLGSGTSAGLYLSTIASNTNAPDSGIGWLQMSSFATWL